MRVAILDKNKVLIGFSAINSKGYDESGNSVEGQVKVPDDCDLALNKYRWTGSTFMPLGFGHGRPSPKPEGVDKDNVFYLLMKALVNDKPIPSECKEWVRWYEQSIKRKINDELKLGGKQNAA